MRLVAVSVLCVDRVESASCVSREHTPSTRAERAAIDASRIQGVVLTIRRIKSEADYESVLETIDGLMGAPADTPEGDALEVLVTLVEAYEVERWKIEAPDPIAAIEHVMEARGLLQRDFAALIGSQPRASEVFNRPRPVARVESSRRRARSGIQARRQSITQRFRSEELAEPCRPAMAFRMRSW